VNRFEKLLSPIKIGSLELRNRIVLPAMDLGFIGVPMMGNLTQEGIDFYEARAKGGAAMIIAGAVAIDPKGIFTPVTPGIWSDDLISDYKRLADAVHKYGAKLVIQIAHSGRQAPQGIPEFPPIDAVAPSPIPCPLYKAIPHELTVDEIQDLVEKFGEAAKRAKEAGADGVEIHGAHGYLIAEFMSPYSNKRFDDYGGSTADRLRFPLETIKRVREKVGSDFYVGFRLSGEELTPGGTSLRETRAMVPILVEAGLDTVSVSAGVYNMLSYRTFMPLHMDPIGTHYDRAASVSEVCKVPVIAVGRIKDPLIAETLLQEGKVDLVAMGRQLITDPELPNKAAAGKPEDIRPCISCGLCLVYLGAQLGFKCELNPYIFKEPEVVQAAQAKKILVVGGGPAGLEAAAYAAIRGHQVTLMDKAEYLGGQWRLAAMPPHKQEISVALKYLVTQAQKAGVKLETSKEVTPRTIDEFEADAVIIATGGEPVIPPIPGVDNPKVITAWDVLAGKAFAGDKVAIIGGGQVGLETADYMREREASQIIVLEQLEACGTTISPFVVMDMMERLTKWGVRVVTSANIEQILDDGIRFTAKGQQETVTGLDSIILAAGVQPSEELSEKIKDKVADVHVIGDANKDVCMAFKNALEAIAEGAEIGLKI